MMDSEYIAFCGIRGESCEGFIRAVRKAAFEAGKIRDDAWMADFASTCLDGPALRFYEELSPDAQGDWRLLRQALLMKYPLPERFNQDVGTEYFSLNRPFSVSFSTAGAAPPSSQPQKGRIKVIGENSADFGYIGNGNASTTSSLGAGASADEALILSYIPCGELHELVIEPIDGKSQLLGLHWHSPSPSCAIGSSTFAALTGFNYEGSHRSSTMKWNGPGATAIWKIAPDGTVWPHLDDSKASTPLRCFLSSGSSHKRSALDAAADAGAFMTIYGKGGSWVLVKLLFQSLD